MSIRRDRLAMGAGLALLFLLCAAAGWLVTLAVMAEPVVGRDVSGEMNEILDRVLPEGDDATGLLEEAMERASGIANEMGIYGLSPLLRLRLGEWDDPRLADALRLWDALLDDAVPLLHEAAQRDAICDPYLFRDGDVTTELWQRRGLFTFLGLAPVAGIRQAAEEGDWEGLDQWVETGLHISRLLDDRPVLLHRQVAGQVRANILHEIRTLAIEGRLAPDVIERLIAAIREADLEIRSVGELSELYVLDERRLLDRYFSRGGLAVLWMLERRPGSDAWHGLTTPPLRDMLWNVRALAAPRRGVVERELLIGRVGATLAWWKSGPADPWMRLKVDVKSKRLHELWMSFSIGHSLHGYLRHAIARETERIGTILVLHLAEHRAAHGCWPKTLAEAAAEEETIDPLAGKPFFYELTPDDPGGAPFRLETAAPPGVGWREWVFSNVREKLRP